MNELRYRSIAIFLTLAFMGFSLSATAQGLPSAEELDALAEADEAEARERAAERERTAQQESVAEEEAVAADESVDEESAEEDSQQEPGDDDWVNPLRKPISPNVNTEGGMGFHHFASAISPGPLMFQVGMLGEGSRGDNVVRHNDQNRMLAGNVVVNASIIDYFGFHARLQARSNLNSFGRPRAMLAQGDLTFGLTGRYPVSPGVWLGGDLNFFVPSSFDTTGLGAGSTSIRPRLLASFDIDSMMGQPEDLYVPVVAHVNIGYRIDNSENLVPEGTRMTRVERFAYGISAYDMLEFGVGAEFPLPYVTPFLGWSLGIPVNPTGDVCADHRALDCVSDIGAAAFPHSLTLGAKGEPLNNLGLHLGVDIGLTSRDAEGLPVTLPYNIHFGMSWNIDTRPVIQIEEREVETIVETAPPSGYLMGRIMDQNTGEPVGDARVVYVDRDMSGHLARSESGLFRSYDFEPGEEVSVEISHPYYEVTTASWVVEEGSQELEIFMEPLPMEAWIRGQVLVPGGADVETLEVLVAARNGTIYEVILDEEGRFEVEVAPGALTIAAMLEGYLTTGRDFHIDPDGEMDFELEFTRQESDIIVGVAETQVRVQSRIEFESGLSSLLEQSHEVLDVVAAVLLENPQVSRIEIQGHTDDAGEEEANLEMTLARAEAVKAYLVERGISADRLETEGYGSTQPLVPNISRRNRSLNRRIEFRILE